MSEPLWGARDQCARLLELTAGTEDRAKEHPLRRDVRSLGILLGRVLIEQAGEPLFKTVEQLRRLLIESRGNSAAGPHVFNQEMQEAQKIVRQLEVREAYRITKAFAIYFELTNLAETNQRKRRRRVAEQPAERRVAFPIVSSRIDNYAFHRRRSVVSRPRSRVATVVFGDHDAARIRIKQHLGMVKPQAQRGLEPSVHAIAVNLPFSRSGNECVPIVVGAIRGRRDGKDSRRLRVVLEVKEKQLNFRRVSRIQAEIHPTVAECGAQGRTSAQIFG